MDTTRATAAQPSEKLKPEEILALLWQEYADKQCGWCDATSYHGHSQCDREGAMAVGHAFSLLLMVGEMPAGVNRPSIPAHFDSSLIKAGVKL